MKRVLIYTIIIFTIIITGNMSSAKDIKFIQVTDTHYALNNEYSQKVLSQTVEKINK